MKIKQFVIRNAPAVLCWVFLSICGFLIFLGIMDVILIASVIL